MALRVERHDSSLHTLLEEASAKLQACPTRGGIQVLHPEAGTRNPEPGTLNHTLSTGTNYLCVGRNTNW